MAKFKNTNPTSGLQGQKAGKLGRSLTGKLDKVQKPVINGNGFPKQAIQSSTLSKPTNLESGKVDGNLNSALSKPTNLESGKVVGTNNLALDTSTNFETTKTDISYNGGAGVISEDEGFPKDDRGFSALGKLNRLGNHKNAKFNQALAGKAEEASADFLGNQLLNYNKGSGPGTLEVPQALNVSTFYILAETGDIINSYGCSSGLPCSSGCEDIQDRLIWPV